MAMYQAVARRGMYACIHTFRPRETDGKGEGEGDTERYREIQTQKHAKAEIHRGTYTPFTRNTNFLDRGLDCNLDRCRDVAYPFTRYIHCSI